MKERPILFSGPMVRAHLDGRKTQTRRLSGLEELNRYPGVLSGPGGFDTLGYKGICPSAYYIKNKAAHKRNPGLYHYFVGESDSSIDVIPVKCPYGQPGDRLIVKEAAWMWCEQRPNGKTKKGRQKWHYVPMRETKPFYCADHPAKPRLEVVSPHTGNAWGWRKKIGRFMPRWASRITLEIVSVRVDRVQEISEEDAEMEGIKESTDRHSGVFDNDQRFQPFTSAFATLWDSINAERGFGWDPNPLVWVLTFKRVVQEVVR